MDRFALFRWPTLQWKRHGMLQGHLSWAARSCSSICWPRVRAVFPGDWTSEPRCVGWSHQAASYGKYRSRTFTDWALFPPLSMLLHFLIWVALTCSRFSYISAVTTKFSALLVHNRVRNLPTEWREESIWCWTAFVIRWAPIRPQWQGEQNESPLLHRRFQSRAQIAAKCGTIRSCCYFHNRVSDHRISTEVLPRRLICKCQKQAAVSCGIPHRVWTFQACSSLQLRALPNEFDEVHPVSWKNDTNDKN